MTDAQRGSEADMTEREMLNAIDRARESARDEIDAHDKLRRKIGSLIRELRAWQTRCEQSSQQPGQDRRIRAAAKMAVLKTVLRKLEAL